MEEINRIKCIIPFTQMIIGEHGYCYSCCSQWTAAGYIGKLEEGVTVFDIWNNEKMQYLREAIYSNRQDLICDFRFCPFAIKGEDIEINHWYSENSHLNTILDEIKQRKTVLSIGPDSLQLSHTSNCNLRCTFCSSHDGMLKQNEKLDNYIFKELLPSNLPKLSQIFLCGNGDVLFNKNSREFLQRLDAEKHPNIKIQLLTNAMLLSPKTWESIKHNRIHYISVSVDAAKKETYEKLRKNGKWEVLVRNLKMISELRRNGTVKFFMVSFIVMKSNHQEMVDFVKLGKEWNCDLVHFQRIMGPADSRENINRTRNNVVKRNIAKQLSHPIMQDPIVDTSLVSYLTDFKGSTNWLRRLLTKFLELLLYRPLRLSNKMLLKTFPILFATRDYFRYRRFKKNGSKELQLQQ